jgi:hypothetical protein
MIYDSLVVDALRFFLIVLVFVALIGLPVIVITIALRVNRKLDRVLEILKGKR